jgi:hypothetical protein
MTRPRGALWRVAAGREERPPLIFFILAFSDYNKTSHLLDRMTGTIPRNGTYVPVNVWRHGSNA